MSNEVPGSYIPPGEGKGRFIRFVENTENVANLALLGTFLSIMSLYNNDQMPAAGEKIATEVNPFLILTIFFTFVASGSRIFAFYEKARKK